MAKDIDIGAQLEPVKNEAGGLRHGGSHAFDIAVELIDGRRDQHRVMEMFGVPVVTCLRAFFTARKAAVR